MRLCCCLLALLGVAGAQQRQPGQGVNFYSCEKEAALGAQMAREVRRDLAPFASDMVREYVERVGGLIAAQLPAGCAGTFGFTFAVVADDTLALEPVALPGGYIFVSTGLILSAQSEAEFAGMLAHAMAHVAERHWTRQATRGEVANFASIPLIFVGGWTGYAARQGAGLAVPMAFLSFQRQMELVADRAAVRAMAAAGYDPGAWLRYVERLPADQGPKAWSPLPARDVRIAAIQEEIGTLPALSLTEPDSLAPIQQEVRRLIPQRVHRVPSLIGR